MGDTETGLGLWSLGCDRTSRNNTHLAIRSVGLKSEGSPGLKRRSFLSKQVNKQPQAAWNLPWNCSISKEVPVPDPCYEFGNYKIHSMKCHLRITFLKRIVLKEMCLSRYFSSGYYHILLRWQFNTATPVYSFTVLEVKTPHLVPRSRIRKFHVLLLHLPSSPLLLFSTDRATTRIETELEVFQTSSFFDPAKTIIKWYWCYHHCNKMLHHFTLGIFVQRDHWSMSYYGIANYWARVA